MKRTIGGDRLGSGKKMTVDLKTYNRSTHDLGYIWRSTMAAGTLVPFMSEVGLPGDTFDINLDCDIKTHPTIGPLFGSYKIQLDVFVCPIRLYQGELHNNKLGIGMKMNSVMLPQIEMEADILDKTKDPDNQQINPSSIFSYLNIRGLGGGEGVSGKVTRKFNGIPYIAYWDIYKNYYANKQEDYGAVIHNERTNVVKNVNKIEVVMGPGSGQSGQTVIIPSSGGNIRISYGEVIKIKATDFNQIQLQGIVLKQSNGSDLIIEDVMNEWTQGQFDATVATGTGYAGNVQFLTITGWDYVSGTDVIEEQPKIEMFPLENIDLMREQILQSVMSAWPFQIDKNGYAPYSLPLKVTSDGLYSKLSSQEGLGIKTYQSDMFNNWLSTEMIDGENGVNAITAIDTSDGSFTLDTLNLSKKVYDMLNRIAVSGGTYDDWLDTVYTHERYQRAESPIYMGGLIKELVFDEVISNAESSEGAPLGTLAGKGVMAKKHKGGHITVKVDEPSYIMGIISLTPRLDYSQGNKWDVNLKTMDDFHKPGLDEIGFQDLITDQMAWFDTEINGNDLTFKSAGKQPAWLNYMTNVNQVRGNFAVKDNEMFMTLNRRYEINEQTGGIADLTTYIDPVKFNHIFAQTSRDAQNFWAQVALDITARRKMSAKIMPNL